MVQFYPASMILAACAVGSVGNACGAVLTVGPGQTYPTIAAAVAASQDGDALQVEAGTYTNDFAEISTKISMIAVGGRVLMRAQGQIPNEKGILITDTDVTITGFTFMGAQVSDAAGGNGAGLRYQGGNLVLNQCWFKNNQDGLLADADPAGTIHINKSEFSNNGAVTGVGAGYTHNIYIGAVALVDIESSYFHHANLGHEVKSRAVQTVINGTRIVDGPTATASYSVDVPNGGAVSISGSRIEQGPNSQNPAMVSFGEEGSLIADSSLLVQTSVLENDLTAHTPVAVANPTSITVDLTNDQTYGLTQAELSSGPASLNNVTPLANEPAISTRHPWLSGQ